VPSYIAMLRGINVSGRRIVRMEQLRQSCAALGFRGVETYVQSGNIIFADTGRSPARLSKCIGEAILRDFGFAAPVLVKTSNEMKEVIAKNPFVRQEGIDASKLHVTFLFEAAPRDGWKKLAAISSGADRFYATGREIYLYCPGGYGRTKLSNSALEKALSVEATTRNWRTVETLFEMASKL
jgi:uncharacterized protein (DUF1697 family)